MTKPYVEPTEATFPEWIQDQMQGLLESAIGAGLPVTHPVCARAAIISNYAKQFVEAKMEREKEASGYDLSTLPPVGSSDIGRMIERGGPNQHFEE